jgi:hypothetical protein
VFGADIGLMFVTGVVYGLFWTFLLHVQKLSSLSRKEEDSHYII